MPKQKVRYQKVIDGEQVFSTFDVLRILDLKRGRLTHWIKGGFIPEGIQIAWGRGSKTVFSLYDVYSIALFKQFVDSGLGRNVASQYMKFVDWHEVKTTKYKLLFIPKFEDSEITPVLSKEVKVLLHLEDFSFGVFINIEKIVSMVNRSI
jgi:hypothetical protein